MRSALSMLLLALAPSAFAQPTTQSIFKCVDGGSTAYQSTPCASGQTEARVMTIGRADPEQPSSAAPISRADAGLATVQTRGKVWPPRRTLMLGMSDDEVLNLPGWGVPKHITRSKASRAWQEEWTYSTGSGERKLYFVNATLVNAVLDAEAVQQIASNRSAGYPAT